MLIILKKNQKYSKTSALKTAIELKSEKMIELLIKYNADVNHEDKYSRTPLKTAIKSDSEKMVELLIKYNANVNYEDKDGGTPLKTAIKSDSEKIAELLIKHNANVNYEDKYVHVPLNTALSEGNEKMVRLLVEHGADIESKDNTRDTLLMRNLMRYKYRRGCISNKTNAHKHCAISFLIKYGADANAVNENNETPLSIAFKETKVDMDVIMLLLIRGDGIYKARFLTDILIKSLDDVNNIKISESSDTLKSQKNSLKK